VKELMPKKKYNCNECGFMFPDELSELIENKTQVYCEKCGKPFSMKGVVFKQAKIQPPSPTPTPSWDRKTPTKKKPSQRKTTHKFAERDRERFDNAIRHLHRYSSIPILIVSVIVLVFASLTIMSLVSSIGLTPQIYNYNINLIVQNIILGISGLSITIYDIKFISPKIKEKKYNEIVVDSFCWGIVGCIIYGAGVLLIIKGIAILIYNMLDNKHFGYNLKNSLNNFSASLGAVIVLLSVNILFNRLSTGFIVGFISTFIFLSLAVFALFIDYRYKKEIYEKKEFFVNDAVLFFILGLIGVIYSAAGIFILLKGILFFFLIYMKPPEEDKAVKTAPIEEMAKEIVREIKIEEIKEKREESIPAPIEEPQEMELTKKQVKELKAHAKKTEKLKKELEKKPTVEKQIELRLHESLLPVKDEKDKELVKHYFTRIFTVLSKELKNQINDLNISKKEKKELLKELAFLTQEEQIKYIESIVDLYQEIPKKLITRIKKLPNVKPKHYDKIVEQLKYLDIEEQVKFVQFLEENA